MIRDDFLWVEKYRPKTVSDCVLPQSLKSVFQQFVNEGNIPNLLLTGRAGVGKTTVAKAMLNELDCDYVVINGSLNGNIEVKSTSSISGFPFDAESVKEDSHIASNSLPFALTF